MGKTLTQDSPSEWRKEGSQVSGNEPAAALASGFLAMLPERVPALSGPTAAKIAHQALDLVALAFASHASTERVTLSSRRATALLRLKTIIEGMLCDHSLKPAIAALPQE